MKTTTTNENEMKGFKKVIYTGQQAFISGSLQTLYWINDDDNRLHRITFECYDKEQNLIHAQDKISDFTFESNKKYVFYTEIKRGYGWINKL